MAAEQTAVALGGHLVTINDDDECDWIHDTFSFYGGQARPLWCGLTDAGAEGEFRWVSGETVDFENWAEGEPNVSVEFAPIENHVFLYPTQNPRERRWRDASDDSFERYLPSALWATVEESWIGAQGLVEVAPRLPQVTRPRMRLNGGRLMLNWERMPRSEYQIQSAAAPRGPWNNVGERIREGTDEVVVGDIDRMEGHAFFRVLVVR